MFLCYRRHSAIFKMLLRKQVHIVPTTPKQKIQVLIELIHKIKIAKFMNNGNYKKIYNKPRKGNFVF